MAAGESAAIRTRLLRRHLAHAARSPFYGELFSQAGLDPRKLRTIEDLAQLPCTTKRDLEGRGRDFLAVPAGDIVDICDVKGRKLGSGITNYTAVEVQSIKGAQSGDITDLLGYDSGSEVVHRNNLVILQLLK